MVFGEVTGRDPRSLGSGECAAFELGMSPTVAAALQQVSFDQLSVTRKLPDVPVGAASPGRCER